MGIPSPPSAPPGPEAAKRTLVKLRTALPDVDIKGAFEHCMQAAELDCLAESRAMQTPIAENYVGLSL